MNNLFISKLKKTTLILWTLDAAVVLLFFIYLFFSGKEMFIDIEKILILVITLVVVSFIELVLTVFRKRLFKRYNLSFIDMIIPASALNFLLAILVVLIFFFK